MTGEIVLDVFTIKTVELYFLSSGVKTIQNVLHIFFFSFEGSISAMPLASINNSGCAMAIGKATFE